jgi:hypothetical protein
MAKPYKIPKKIAGQRIPRSIRKSAVLGDFLQNPHNRQLAANMVMAAAGAVGTVLAQARPNAKQVKQAAHDVDEAGSSAAGAVAETVTRIARSLASNLSSTDDVKKRDHPKKLEDTADARAGKPH